MRVEIEDLARGVDPKAAAAWWGDFRSGRDDHAFVPGATRRVTPAQPGAFHLEEETRLLGVTVWRETSTAHVGTDEVRFRGHNALARFEGRYAFEPDAKGTRVRLVADIRLAKMLAWSDAVARPIVEQILEADLRGHLRQMTRDLKRR